MYPTQVDMYDNYLHLCEGGVFMPVDLSPKELSWLEAAAKLKGMTPQGYLASIVPELLARADEIIAQHEENKKLLELSVYDPE